MFKSPRAKRFLYRVIPRRVHRAYSALLGYFWLPCPNCGQNFGGHEIPDPAAYITDDDLSGWIVCPLCTVKTGLTSAIPDTSRSKDSLLRT